VEALDFSDFLLISDGVAALNQRDADEIAKIRAAQGK
jgi:hypothetical protein